MSAIELEENTKRLDLLDYEASKARLTEIRKAEAEAETPGESPHVSRGPRGPATQAGSRRDVADRTGISPKGQREIERHVDLAEQYPAFKRPGWRQYNVLEAAVGKALGPAEHGGDPKKRSKFGTSNLAKADRHDFRLLAEHRRAWEKECEKRPLSCREALSLVN